MTKDEKRTICFAGNRFHKERQGGVELQTRYLAEALAQAGWKIAFLVPSADGRRGYEEADNNIEVWWYPSFSYTFQAPTSMIERMLDAIEPSAFYQRGRGQLLESGIILRYARKRSIPFVFALSSDRDLDHLYATKANLTAYKPMWKRLVVLPYSFWLDRARGCVLRHADKIVVQHEGQMQAVSKKQGRIPYLLRTIHPEVGGEVRKSVQKTVLWVNNCRPMKQGELFVRLARECKQISCRFVLVHGRTKPEYLEPVLREARGTENLTVLGEMSPAEVESLMEEAALFVNTSLPMEGFPNTFVQSWLRETPTLSLCVDPGGVLRREEIGICSGNFGQLVKDTAYLVENDRERVEMARRARRYAEQMHGFAHNAGRIAEFFESVASGARASA